jgi:N-acetylglucosaminyldiphosphoundecaprenol N-acetyl-beta-D-mannosaminyltransferase
METAQLLGFNIAAPGVPAALSSLENGPGGAVYFVNTHSLTEAQRLPELAQAFRTARHCFADGMPLLWLARATGQCAAERVCGPDLMAEALRAFPSGHALIGGPPGQAERVLARFGRAGPTFSPPFRDWDFSHPERSRELAREEFSAWLATLGTSAPRYLWVSLGAPKQELWIAAVADLAPQSWLLGVGAAFAFLADDTARAPAWMQRAGLEWTHRLAQDPSRLLGRYLGSGSRFAMLALKQVLGGGKSSR